MTNKVPAFTDDVRDRTWQSRRLGNYVLLSQADIAMLNALKPRCAKCGKVVDRITWRCSPEGFSVVFTVECHGQVEETTVTFKDFPTLMMNGVQGAEAFRDVPRLENNIDKESSNL